MARPSLAMTVERGRDRGMPPSLDTPPPFPQWCGGRCFATVCNPLRRKTMPTITLPDGSQRQFANPVTGAEVAAAIGPGLAKAALAVKLNGQVKDRSEEHTSELQSQSNLVCRLLLEKKKKKIKKK